MAEAIALVASIVAVIQVTDRLSSLCKSYIGGVVDYPKDLREILLETSSLKTLFENLQFLNEKDGGASTLFTSMGGEDGPIERCRRTTSELEQLFPPEQLSTNRKRKRNQKFRPSLAGLAWPFKKEKARALLTQLASHKASISLAISADTLYVVL